mgnify:CR=1 FL=1
MDAGTLAVFKADMAAQEQAVERVFALLEKRSQGLTAEAEERLESTAYQLHNFYSAVEDWLKLIATAFENNVSDTAQWHSALLRRMTQPVEGVRPAVLALETYQLLNALRSFRHFFRHAYGVPIELTQLQENVHKAMQLKPLLDRDIKAFMKALEA